MTGAMADPKPLAAVMVDAPWEPARRERARLALKRCRALLIRPVTAASVGIRGDGQCDHFTDPAGIVAVTAAGLSPGRRNTISHRDLPVTKRRAVRPATLSVSRCDVSVPITCG